MATKDWYWSMMTGLTRTLWDAGAIFQLSNTYKYTLLSNTWQLGRWKPESLPLLLPLQLPLLPPPPPAWQPLRRPSSRIWWEGCWKTSKLWRLKQFLVKRPNHAQSDCYSGTRVTDFAITDPNHPVTGPFFTQGQCYSFFSPQITGEGLMRKSDESPVSQSYQCWELLSCCLPLNHNQ